MAFDHKNLLVRVNAKKISGRHNVYRMFHCIYEYVPERNVFVFIEDSP